MLSSIRQTDGAKVIASNLQKGSELFICPECGERVLLRTGRVTAAHFAHAASGGCLFSHGETEGHRRCKTDIYEALREHPLASEVALEFPLGSVRPDVFARINNVPVAIEVQVSNLSLDAITERTREYARLGIHVLWLLQWRPELESGRFTPRPFERWVHAAYFGRAYFWAEGLIVLPYRFEPHLSHVKERTWRQGGEQVTAGGYTRRSKRYRAPVRGTPLDLVEDFRPATRAPFYSKTLHVPAAKLFVDTRSTSARF